MNFYILIAAICVQSIDALRVDSLHKQCTDRGFDGLCAGTLWFHKYREVKCHWPITCAVHVKDAMIGDETVIIFEQSAGLPLNGTKCGRSKICINGNCEFTKEILTIVGPRLYTECYAGRVPDEFRRTPRTI